MTGNRRGSYPHPVLDDSDDIDSTFQVFNIAFQPTVDDVQVRFQIRMDDPDIAELLTTDRARVSVRWTCSATLTSRELNPVTTHHADSIEYVDWIDQQDIRGPVRVDLRIVAVAPVPGYRPSRQHSDYGGTAFDLLPGDIIGDAGYFTFEPTKLYDPMNPPIGSCFRFMADSRLRKRLEVRFLDDDYIDVAIPESLLPGLSALSTRPDLQISLVVLPALMETLGFIRRATESGDLSDLTGRHWYAPILALIDSVGSLSDPPFELAQKMLGDPLHLSLTASTAKEADDD